MPDTATITHGAETLTFADPPRRHGILVPSSSTAWSWTSGRTPGVATAIDAPPDRPPHIVILDRQNFVFGEQHVLLARMRDVTDACLLIEARDQSSSTATSEAPPVQRVEATLEDILAAAQNEDFELGMCSEFEGRLRDLVGDYGEAALAALHDRMRRGLKTDIALEALHAIGRMRHGLTRDARLGTLAAFLRHPEAAIRDAAMRGLLDMEDARARPVLRQAVAVEPNKLLKKSLQEVLALIPK